MATLKEHQAAMVDLLANGSGIPASASRLAHAMHDLINVLYVAFPNLPQTKDEDWINGRDTSLTITPDITLGIKDIIRAVEANSPGLNEKALSKREKTLKTDSPAKWPKAERFNVNIKLSDMDEVKTTLHNMQSHLDGARDSQRAAEQRVKELENTIRQLKANNAKLKQELEQSRKLFDYWFKRCVQTPLQPEHAGCRREDTQVCEHDWHDTGIVVPNVRCSKCGEHQE